MTTVERSLLRTRPVPALVLDQLDAIDRWQAARRAELARAATLSSRELRLDASRRADVLQREHRALADATERALARSGDLLEVRPAPRVVVAHRNDWFAGKVGGALAGAGLAVVAQLSNGADAVGVAVAEQPDVLLLEDRLPMLTAEDVLAEVSAYCPATVVAVQVDDDDAVARWLDAGARAAWSRRVPPADVAAGIAGMFAS